MDGFKMTGIILGCFIVVMALNAFDKKVNETIEGYTKEEIAQVDKIISQTPEYKPTAEEVKFEKIRKEAMIIASLWNIPEDDITKPVDLIFSKGE